MYDSRIDRAIDIVNHMFADADPTTEDGNPPELFGGLSPYNLDSFDPVAEAHEVKRRPY